MRLLMCPWWYFAIYMMVFLLIVPLMVLGFEITGECTAEFYGLELVGFNIRGDKIVENAYLEFCTHLWWISLFFLSCGTLKLWQNSWSTSFENFLRFSHRSRFYIESVRISVLLLTLFLVLLPFLWAALWGRLGLNFRWSFCGHLFCIEAIPLIFVAILIYILSWSEGTRSFAAYSLMTPFFCGGIALFIGKQWKNLVVQYWFPCLPYSIPQTHSIQAMCAVCVFGIIVFLIRIAVTAKTNWIR